MEIFMNDLTHIEVEILCTFNPDSKQGSQLDVVAVLSQNCQWKDPEFDHQLFIDKGEALKALVSKGYLTKEYCLTQLGEAILRYVDS